MNINYQLTNSDFITYQLYTSSKSALQRKRRFRSRVIVPLIYLLFGLYMANSDGNITIGIVFVAVAIFWFAMYPMYAKWRYKRYFEKHVEENYKNRINKLVELDFDENSMNAKDPTSESRINRTELKELIETKNHFFIKLTTDSSIIVPKHSVENQTEFKKLMTELGANYVDELNWEWK